MIFADIPAGATVFLDANPLVYHFAPHPVLGPACTDLMQRIEKQEVAAFTSTHLLSELAHHLMTFEAANKFGWTSKVVDRLKQQPALIQQLSLFRDAVQKIPQLGIQVETIPTQLIETAASLSLQYGLLSNDALVVAAMQNHGLINLASNDSDFDRVPWVVRFAPA